MIELIADGFFVDGIFKRTFLSTRDAQNPDIHHIPYTGITPLYIHESVVNALQLDSVAQWVRDIYRNRSGLETHTFLPEGLYIVAFFATVPG